MGGRTLTLSGTLPLAEPVSQGELSPVPAGSSLVAAVVEVRAGRGDMAEVMALFRAATLWVERDGDQQVVRAVEFEGLRWLPVFTSLEQLAVFAQASRRGDQEVHYGRLSGAEIVEECLPLLPVGTGMVLDPLADHVLPLPAVRGIVPDSRAIDGEAHGGS